MKTRPASITERPLPCIGGHEVPWFWRLAFRSRSWSEWNSAHKSSVRRRLAQIWSGLWPGCRLAACSSNSKYGRRMGSSSRGNLTRAFSVPARRDTSVTHPPAGLPILWELPCESHRQLQRHLPLQPQRAVDSDKLLQRAGLDGQQRGVRQPESSLCRNDIDGQLLGYKQGRGFLSRLPHQHPSHAWLLQHFSGGRHTQHAENRGGSIAERTSQFSHSRLRDRRELHCLCGAGL